MMVVKAPLPLQLVPCPSPSSSSSRKSNRSFMKKCVSNYRVFVVRSSYSSKPLKTAGAYQVVDDETGEKLIVWGGAGDEPSIPPNHLLHSSNWNPNPSQQTADNDSSMPSAASFSRLKAQRVRALANKISSTRKKVSQPEDQHSQSERHSLGKNKIVNSLKEVQRFSTADIEPITAARHHMDDSNVPVECGVSDNQIEPAGLRKSDAQADEAGFLVPRASNAYLRGWGNGGSIHNFKSESKDLPKQRRKFSTDTDFFSRKSFKELGCADYMIESLKRQNFLRPSRIQAMAFTPAIAGKSCIIADQSGSGKTLAYLLPVIQHLREEELQGLSKSASRSPRVIIMVPTAELASQVLNNCRSISKFGVPFRSMVVTGGFRQRTQLENLQQGVDVLIATPGRIMFLIKQEILQLSTLKCAVLDEVDILFNDDDFEVALQTLISSAPVTSQYLFVTATLPVAIYNKLVEVFPDCEVIVGPSMHRISSGLEEVLVDCSGDNETDKTQETAFLNKKSALLQLVEESPVAKTIVFCNKIETCRKVENVLKRFDRKGTQVRVLPFHAALEQGSRLANMKEFTNSHYKEGCLFLVCTDRASRGIDFAGVDHVILFDFPRDPSEYVRRVGRTARGAGGKGRAFIFVVGKQVSLARKIMERNRKGHPLHDVPSAFELVG
ncbi:DEAD-box ATP-dependent RNA helicase 50 isoform X2 [Mangifera indica]|uniref:DEAD-box ATP-dependent RNA helicase 50 isoform X2 n=1 Tax=Mangifera indica TaxID=29780 RepID=UPI001CFB952C|nr:DEAD-box ATP-dependent RNA helicase 50 isoform X2 [Mangifera indica]